MIVAEVEAIVTEVAVATTEEVAVAVATTEEVAVATTEVEVATTEVAEATTGDGTIVEEEAEGGGRFSNLGGPSRRQRSKDGKAVGPKDERRERELFGDQHASGINFKEYDDIPVETSGQDIPPGIKNYEDIDLAEVLLENIALAHYTNPTPVQKHAIPISLAGRDIMSCAQTGSGKTAAFLFPMIQRLLTTELADPPPSDGRYRSRTKYHPHALVLAPTRELATQIFNEAEKFCYRSGIRPVVVYGGQDIRQQFSQLDRGVDIIVATPGRLNDMYTRGRMSFSLMKYLVFDEADRMLDMGFEPQIREIVERCDMPWEGRQTAMFSATFPKEIQRLAQDFLTNYIFLAVGRVGSSTQNIKQKVRYCQEPDKRDNLLKILPDCDGLTLIFVETKRSADALEDFLRRQDVNATSIHGDRTQGERERALAEFRCGRCPVLVATSVAARGLDIPNVLHVINYDMPSSIDDYVHRIGRTGRCGNTGTAIAFINEKNRNIIRDLYEGMKETQQEIEPWFESMANSSSFGSYSKGRGGGKKSRYGARDFRKDNDGGGGGRFGGGGGGGGRFGGGGGGGYSGGGGGGGNRSDAW